MHQASASVGVLAAALAKAQAELLNPEKSLIGTVAPGEGRPERTFRYAPLSSGLEIIRTTLGRHEIATIQTTAIDDGAGLIRLTTILVHSSGEWISSEWPVCPVSETAQPHRLGTALTYARRYALFTLVGIAGEDDTDAPDLHLSNSGAIQGTDPAATSGSREKAFQPQGLRRQRMKPPKPVLGAEASAALRQQLLAELAAASAEDLTTWATRRLPDKNSLTPDDSRAVDEAFASKIGAVEPDSPMESRDHSEDPVAALEQAVAVNGGSPPRLVPRTIRRRDKEHLKFVAAQPCLVCGRQPSDAHHLRFSEPRALGRKVSDEFTVPLCRGHHRALHARGDERAWWRETEIDPAPIAERLWSATR